MAGKVSTIFEREGKIVLSLQGQYTGETARENISLATRLVRQLESCEFVMDLRNLEGYETGARTAWQESLAEFKKRVRAVTLVGGSPLIRMTGSAVCLYAGIKCRLVDDLEEAFRSQTIAPR